jgi:replicative DNA helicase
MFINRKPPHLATQDERGVAEIILAKQRNGPTGSFELAFLEPFTRFENLAVVEGP